MSELNLESLKIKFSKKATVNIEDVDLAMNAVPYLIRVIEDLEKKLEKTNLKLENLYNRLNMEPVLSLSGSMWKSEWSVDYEADNNLLVVVLKGKFNSKTARKASNDVLSISGTIKDEFSVINNMNELDSDFSMKSFFHFKKASFNMKNHGMKRLVRVVNPKNIILMKLFSSESLFFNSQSHIAKDMEEARKIVKDADKYLIT